MIVELIELNTAAVGILTIALYFIGSCVYNVYFHPLRSFPGPKILAAFSFPRIFTRTKGIDVFYLRQLHDRYGEVVRTGPSELSFTTSHAWKDIYSHSSSGKPILQKDPDAYGGSPPEDTGMFVADEANHTRQRRAFAPAFSDRALKQQEHLFLEYAELLMEKLVEKSSPRDGAESGTSEKVNIVDMYNFTTFDIMADLTFGEPLQMLRGSVYDVWVKGTFDAIKYACLVSTLHFYFPTMVKLLLHLLPPSLRKKRDDHFRYAAERVTKRLQRQTERPDIWGLVVPKDGGQATLTLKEMHGNAGTFMLAGSETTATLLSGLTFHLLKNPEKMNRLISEIRNTFHSKEDITLQGLMQLKYLHACLEEALRVYPPAPAGLPRRTPRGGCTIAGRTVPRNVTVGLHQYSAYHSSRNFALPDDFIPERWLTGTEADARFANDDKEVLHPFSIGPRNCIGQNLAYHEMRLIMAYLLWHFDVELCDESKEWTEQKVLFLWMKPPLMVRLRPVVRE
ncbi:uncharacterized protein K452DRAFT_271236 [Aplosporella prunicola CBS 121167]|uniref:Cytochrome P450 n=1 Tax=Aplosporella prunicola CBS 121167 TaxID=1176127 RepID=A0A6A6BC43_9PEZI|nr:uncharacterized protein K452DRAFT_271236 [Aplosporella prunicola CBS 121167]KAF2141616.1 hypothetical protein K452DRAFT_271236 [Aplosporella prunicola CBS 121167]